MTKSIRVDSEVYNTIRYLRVLLVRATGQSVSIGRAVAFAIAFNW